MEVEGLKVFNLDTLNIHIRKHGNDCYSGKVLDGHKLVHEFANRSLPEITTELMSLMEYPLDPDDAGIIDESIDDKDIKEKLKGLIQDYKQNSISNIYDEVQNIRQEMRNGTAVDLQQVEAKMLKLIEQLKETTEKEHTTYQDRLDSLTNELQSIKNILLHSISGAPTYGIPNPTFRDPYMMDPYSSFSRPTVTHLPNKIIRIVFNKDWPSIKKSEYLKDANLKKVEL
jgi:hypothetical protein